MARKLRAKPHIKRLHAHHKKHKKQLLDLFHKVRSHPGMYQAGIRPKRQAKPKSLPRQPRGLNKRGAGLWATIKKGWHWLTGNVKKHGKKIAKEVSKHAKEVGKQLLEEGKTRAKAYGKQMLDRGTAAAKRHMAATGERLRGHVESYISKAESKVNGIASKVDSAVSKISGDGQMPGKSLKA